ncbi:MAG: BTAD domain-containing putative transcriptional regulator [Steroidobacteraceae bacterium]
MVKNTLKPDPAGMLAASPMPSAPYFLRLLGGFDVLRDGRSAAGGCYGKMQALLAYLAAESDRIHSRQALAGLLWPERDEDHARQSLRQALTGLRAALGGDAAAEALLATSRETVALNRDACQTDLSAFAAPTPPACPQGLRDRAACRRCHQSAAAHYRGSFLAGLSVPDAPEFDSWLALKRERFARRATELYAHLAACHEQSGEFAGALRYARRQLRIDPWDEEAHRQVIRLLALGGSRNAALSHYRRMHALLAEELGVEPDETTRELYASIRAGRTRRTALTPAERLGQSVSPWGVRECAAAPLGHAGERHVLTVLSLELCCAPQTDPEQLYGPARRLVEAAEEHVPRHGGLIRESGNLELIAYFGYPRPCERPAMHAVQAALALCGELGAFVPRARVHTGTVFVPPRLRAGCDPNGELIGTVPLLARRLQRLAPQATVAISAQTWGAAGDGLETRPLTAEGGGPEFDGDGMYEVLGLRAAADTPLTSAARRALRLERAALQLEQLGPAKRLAQLAACLDPTFTEAQLQQMLHASAQLGFDAHELAAQLQTLLRTGVWAVCPGGEPTRYRFRQRPLREAALQGQSLAVRRLYRRMLRMAGSR